MIFNYLLCILHLYFAPSIFLQFKQKPDRNGGQYLFAKKYIEEERYIYIIYILYVCFGIPKNPCLRLMN